MRTLQSGNIPVLYNSTSTPDNGIVGDFPGVGQRVPHGVNVGLSVYHSHLHLVPYHPPLAHRPTSNSPLVAGKTSHSLKEVQADSSPDASSQNHSSPSANMKDTTRKHSISSASSYSSFTSSSASSSSSSDYSFARSHNSSRTSLSRTSSGASVNAAHPYIRKRPSPLGNSNREGANSAIRRWSHGLQCQGQQTVDPTSGLTLTVQEEALRVQARSQAVQAASQAAAAAPLKESEMARSLEAIRHMQIQGMLQVRAKQQAEFAQLRAGRKKRPSPPPPITAEQRALARFSTQYSILENEYREEIIEYMFQMEELTMPAKTAMEQQPDLSMEMRRSLLDFLVELHQVFHLKQETLYLGVNVLDRYASKRIIHRKHYQLVGCTALWVAAKFEDAKENIPTSTDLAQYCRGIYEESAFIQMEGHVLATINWQLGHPTCEGWLKSMIMTLEDPTSHDGKKTAVRQGWVGLTDLKSGVPVMTVDGATLAVSRYLMEVMLYMEALIDVPSSVKAEAALILGKAIHQRVRFRERETPNGLIVAKYLDELLAKGVDSISETIYSKYHQSDKSAAMTVTKFYLNVRMPTTATWNHLDSLVDYVNTLEPAEDEDMCGMASSDDEAYVDARSTRESDAAMCDAASANVSFADSGYGSVVGDDSIMNSPGEKENIRPSSRNAHSVDAGMAIISPNSSMEKLAHDNSNAIASSPLLAISSPSRRKSRENIALCPSPMPSSALDARSAFDFIANVQC